MKVWLNGDVKDVGTASIDVSDRGFLLGDGLFETLLAEGGRVRFAAAHLERLRAGAEALGIPVPFNDEALTDAFDGVLRANDLKDAVRASLRLTLTRGPGPRGILPPQQVVPTALVTASAAPPPPHAMTATISTLTRRNEFSPLSGIKSLDYLDNILARREAKIRGYDEAILLNTAGRVAETTAANIFVWNGACLCTSAVTEGALPGITRRLILECAQHEGLEALETTLEADMLHEAQEVFITSSLIGAVPLIRIDSSTYEVGPIHRALSQAYTARLRED